MATLCPIPSVRVCHQPCQIVSDPRIWKCKTPRRAEKGLFRGSHEPQTARQAREPPFQKTLLSIYVTPTILVHQDTPGAWCPITNLLATHRAASDSRSCRRASALLWARRRIAVCYTFLSYVIHQGRVCEGPVSRLRGPGLASGVYQPTRLGMAPYAPIAVI